MATLSNDVPTGRRMNGVERLIKKKTFRVSSFGQAAKRKAFQVSGFKFRQKPGRGINTELENLETQRETLISAILSSSGLAET
jgi:hypothetical protein